MQPQELADRLRVRGHEVRARGDEVVFRRCVFCGNDRWNLEASGPKGVYHCWAGGCSGTLASLLEAVGAEVPAGLEVRWDGTGERRAHLKEWGQDPVATVSLASQPSAMAYLRQRGVDEAAARWLGVAVQTEGRDTPRIVVPVREFWSGRPVGVTTRGYGPATGPKYRNYVTCHDSLPGWRDAASHYIVVVEGVFDALAVRRAGFGAAMLLGTGSRGNAIWWAAQARPGTTLVVMLDPDAAPLARGLVQDMKTVWPRVRRAELPEGTDPATTPVAELQRHVLEAQ